MFDCYSKGASALHSFFSSFFLHGCPYCSNSQALEVAVGLAIVVPAWFCALVARSSLCHRLRGYERLCRRAVLRALLLRNSLRLGTRAESSKACLLEGKKSNEVVSRRKTQRSDRLAALAASVEAKNSLTYSLK